MDPQLFEINLCGQRLYSTITYTTRKQWTYPESRNFHTHYESDPRSHYLYVCFLGLETSFILARPFDEQSMSR